jgi:capsular polysaccharide biosynthesis protein
MLNAYGKSESRGPERIFVSRAGLARQQRLLNEIDLYPELRRLGFDIVNPEHHSLPEQICIFKDARVILGAFGAGLTNMMFCQPSSTILELQEPVFAPRFWYWKVASIMRHEWRCYVGRCEMGKRLTADDWPSATFTVDKYKLVRFVEDALQSSGQRNAWHWQHEDRE